jgi:hypothetical protein
VAESILIIAVSLAWEQLIAATLANTTPKRNNAIADFFVLGAFFKI